MPMKEVPGLKIPPARQNQLLQEVNSFFRRILGRYYVNPAIFPPMKHRFTAVYSRDKEYLFDINSPDFFTPATRSRIVQFILDRTRFTIDKEDDFAFGIERLINERAYSAAYPLHDVSIFKLHSFWNKILVTKNIRNKNSNFFRAIICCPHLHPHIGTNDKF